MKNIYEIKKAEEIITPALIYYEDIILDNLNKMIETAGDRRRLWPHVKSHKMEKLVRLQMEKGISKFKCATIAEAEMVGTCGAAEAVIAYPLIGPNVARFLKLQVSYPKTRFWAIGDDIEQLRILSAQACEKSLKVNVLIDVNMGTNRTGVEVEKLYDLYMECCKLPGLSLNGLHCYDGNHGIENYEERRRAVEEADHKVFKVVERIKQSGENCDILIMGGTPSFPCHAKYGNVYLSPGTCVISDDGYYHRFQDENFVPAGILMTRVVSHAAEGYFTIDLGYKGIASYPQGQRGRLLGVEHAVSVGQNEEHWIWKMESGYENERPQIGTVLYVIPTHICPTSALYPSALVARNSEIVDEWLVTARNRKITI